MKGTMDPKILEEMEELKLKEKESREEILRLQDYIRLIRN